MTRCFKSKWFLLFLLIPFFKPICFQYYAKLHMVENLFVAWKMFSALIIIFQLIVYVLKQSKLSKMIIWVFLFEFSIVFSTVINHGYLMRSLIDAISIVSYVAWLSLAMKYNRDGLIHLLGTYMGFLMIINLCVMVVFPGGLHADLYTNKENALYFMVTDNGSSLFLIFCVLTLAMEGMVTAHRISGKNKLLITGCFLSAVLSHSATTIFTVTLLIISLLFVFKSNVTKVINPAFLFLLYLLFFIYLITMQDNVVSRFILVNLFNRSSNFSGRYVLWKIALRMIRMRPWLGYGRIAHDYILAWGGYFSSHNYILEILLQGGLLAFMLFAGLVLISIKRLLLLHQSKVTNCLILALWVIMIAALMESAVHSVYIFGVIFFCYHCNRLGSAERERIK